MILFQVLIRIDPHKEGLLSNSLPTLCTACALCSPGDKKKSMNNKTKNNKKKNHNFCAKYSPDVEFTG